MPQPYASSRGITLEDLLSQGGGGSAPAPAAPQVAGTGDPYEAQRQALLAQLMQPDQTVPDQQAPKPNGLAQLLMGLGDAGNAYASIIGNAPQVRTDTLGNYMAYLTQQKDSADRFNERKKLGDAESKRRNLVIGLNELDTKQARADAAKAKTELLAYQTQQKKDAIAQHALDLADAEARDNRAAARDAKIRSDFAAEREIHDAAQERLHEKQRQGDKIALRDEAKIDAVKEYIGTLADNLDDILKVKDPVAVMNSARRFMDRQSMSKDAREIVESYMRQEVTSRIVEQNDLALDAGSPQQQDPNAPMTPWQRNPSDAAGAVVGRVAQPFIDSAKGIGNTPAGSAIKRVWNRGVGN